VPAAAFTPASLEARLGAVEVATQLLVGELGPANLEQLQGIGAAYDENASADRFAAGGGGGGRLFWGFWRDYPKVVEAGREYAQIGERLYTQHAIERMLPSGLGAPAGAVGAGRSVAPAFVEAAIETGTTSTQVVGGVTRTIYTSGSLQVVTEQGGRIVITVIPGAP
jgi:hypothetical protein